MVVLVARQGQAVALDGVRDETRRRVVVDAVEGLEHGLHVVTGEVGHHLRQRRVVVARQQRRHVRLAGEILDKPLAPRRAALEGQRAVQRIGAVVDPALERLAAGQRERFAHLLAVFQGDHVPPGHAEHALDAVEQAVADDAVQALAVVIDDPPGVAEVVLPAFQQGLEDVALVDLGVAEDGHHAARRVAPGDELAGPEVVLGQRGEDGDRRAQADGPGGEVHVVAVLGPRGIGLGPAHGAEPLQHGAALAAEQVLDGVEDRARMGLHGDPVPRPERVHIQRRHQCRHRGARRLVAAHLQPVRTRPHVVGVMDHPRRQPQHLALDCAQAGEAFGVGKRHRPGAGQGLGCGHDERRPVAETSGIIIPNCLEFLAKSPSRG